jgi:hypothetical protein
LMAFSRCSSWLASKRRVFLPVISTALHHKCWILQQNFTFPGRERPAAGQNWTPAGWQFVYISTYLPVYSHICVEFL